MTAKTKSQISKIGWYQIIGGAYGAFLIVYALFQAEEVSWVNVLVYLFMLSFFLYSIFCGILCVKHTSNALTHSLVNQFLQLISFAFFGVSFAYVAGVYFSAGFDLAQSSSMHFNIGTPNFNFYIHPDDGLRAINFNAVAFAFIFWIDRLRGKIKAEKIEEEILAVGKE